MRPRPAGAVVSIDVTQGNIQPIPIAMPDFVGGSSNDGDVARNVTQVIAANLKRSGLFAPIDPAAYIEKVSNIDALPRFADWRTINAQALVTGRITRQSDGRLKSEFRLWDVASAEQLTGAQYFTAPDIWRRVAHIISDAIYQRLTGETGYFDSRVVFVDESGPKEQPGQAARHHGSGRRQRAHPHPRQRSRADAAVLAVDARNHLHVVRQQPAAGLSAQHRDQPARGGRRFPQHDASRRASRPTASA